MAGKYLGATSALPEDLTEKFFEFCIKRRPCGPYPSGPICTLELWERRAVELLDRFTEVGRDADNSIGVPVCGEWKWYCAPDDTTHNHLIGLALGLLAVNDAFDLFASLGTSSTPVDALNLAWACMTAVTMLTDVGVTTSRAWKDGERVACNRQQGTTTVNQDHCELHSQYQDEIDRLMNYGAAGGHSYAKAKAQVAARFGVNARTVDNHTVNKWPQKGGRPRKAKT